MKTRILALLVLTEAWLLACGRSTSPERIDATNQGSPQGRNTFAVNSPEDVPTCDASSSGYIVYILSSKSLQACLEDTGSYKWTSIDYASRSDLDNFVRKDELGNIVLFDQLAMNKARKIYESYRRSVYRLVLFCSNGTLAGGTGYKCEEDAICTNKHVVDSCSSSSLQAVEIARVQSSRDTLESYFYRALPSIIRATPSNLDLAKIKISSTYLAGDKTFSQANANSVKTFDQILSMSFPLLLEDLFSDLGYVKVNSIGECNGYANYGCLENYFHFVSSNDTDHGSSGSPLIDIESEQVVGLTTAGYGDNLSMNPNIAVSAHLFFSTQYWP